MHRRSSRSLAAAAICAAIAIAVCDGVFARATNDGGDAVASRRTTLLERSARNPFPKPTCVTPPKTASDACIWGKLDQALSLLYLDRNDDDLRNGNALVADVVRMVPTLPKFGSPNGLRTLSEDEFHFTTAQLMYQIYALFGPRDGSLERRLTAQNAAGIASVFFAWARTSCPSHDADPARSWDVYGSENHEAMTNGACWDAADVLSHDAAYAGKRYADGSTPASSLAAWNRFLTTYIRERGRRGLIRGIRLGVRRVYATELLRLRGVRARPRAQTAGRRTSGFLVGGVGARAVGRIVRRGRARAFLSEHRSLGAYAGRHHRLAVLRHRTIAGLSGRQHDGAADEHVSSGARDRGARDVAARHVRQRIAAARTRRIDARDAVRRVLPLPPGERRHPSLYVCDIRVRLGTAMFARLPGADWPADSSQNRWNGVMLGNDSASVVYAIPAAAPKPYNGIWGVQDKATQIVQKLRPPYGNHTGPMQMYVASTLQKREVGGWIFASDGTAYVAMRPASGGWRADAADPRFADLDDDASPVILQAGSRDRYPTLDDFARAVARMAIRVSPDLVTVRGLDGAAELRFFPRSGAMPRVGGRPVDASPDFTFRSPFVNEAWNSGTVRIGRAGDELALDFGD